MNRPALTLAALVAIGVLTACPKEKEYEDGEHQKKMALKLPVGTPKRPEGMSALHLTHAGEISKQLVVDYFKTHNLPMNYTTTNDFQVENVDVITAKQVTERLQGVTTGLADDEQVTAGLAAEDGRGRVLDR